MTRVSKELAMRCCEKKLCKACGEALRAGWGSCDRCRAEDRIRMGVETWERAESVTPREATEMVYIDDTDEHTTIDEALDRLEAREVFRVYCTKEEKLRLDGGAIIESALSDWYEDAYNCLPSNAERELQELLDGWTSSSGEMRQYHPDWKRKVVLAPK
jgi:hypothetical protein